MIRSTYYHDPSLAAARPRRSIHEIQQWSRIQEARKRASDLISNPSISQLIAEHCDPSDALSLALTSKSVFGPVAGTLYRTVDYKCLRRRRKQMPAHAHEQIYINGVRSITHVPPHIDIAGVSELFSIYPNCLSITWLEGDRASRKSTRSASVDSQHRLMTADYYTDQLRFLMSQRQASFLSTSTATTGNQVVVQPGDTTDLIISDFSDLYGIYIVGSNDVRTLATAFERAKGIFSLHHRRLDIGSIWDREQSYNAIFTDHLKSRHTKALVPYLEIHLHEPADSRTYASRALEAFKAIIDYNPDLTTLRFALQVRTQMIYADLGTEQLLTQCEWHCLPHLENLSIMLELDCQQTEEVPTQTPSIRPECKLLPAAPTHTRTRGNHVDPATPLPKRSPKLQRLAVELHSMSKDPWLPDVTFLAQCLVAIGGPYCRYDVVSAEGQSPTRLPIVQNAIRLLERAIKTEVGRQRAGEVQGWTRMVKM